MTSQFLWFNWSCIFKYVYTRFDKLHDSTHFFLPTQRQFCVLGDEKTPLFPFPCPAASPRNPVSVRVTGDGRQSLWCGQNLCLEQCGAMLDNWHFGQRPMLSARLLVMINECILSTNSWVCCIRNWGASQWPWGQKNCPWTTWGKWLEHLR